MVVKEFNKCFKLCIAMFSCFNISNIYSADSKKSQISLCFKAEHKFLKDIGHISINIKFKLKVNDNYIDDCWKDYLNVSIYEFLKSKYFSFNLDGYYLANINGKKIVEHFKNNGDVSDNKNIKDAIIEKYNNEGKNIELDKEYNLNFTDFTLGFFKKEGENDIEITKDNTISQGLKKVLNNKLKDNKNNINEFFGTILDKTSLWSQFIQDTKIEIIEKDKNLTMNIKLYLDFPKPDKIFITYNDPIEAIKKEVLNDFYKNIAVCKSFDEKINFYNKYKLDNEFFSAAVYQLNLKIVNKKSDADIDSLRIIKEIDSIYKCDELLKIYKQFKNNELSPLFIFKEDLNLQNENIGDYGNRETKISNKRYKVLYYLAKEFKDSLSEDFKKILGYFYFDDKSKFDKFFKNPLNKYNIREGLDDKVFDCGWLYELYLYLTDKRKYCIEILKFNRYTLDKLFEFRNSDKRINNYSSFLKFYEYYYSQGINVEDLYKNLLNNAKTKFEKLYENYINDFDKFISNLESTGKLFETETKTKIEDYFIETLNKPIDIISKLNITKKEDNLIDIIKCIYGKAIEDYFTIKKNNIHLNINELFLQKFYKHLIDKVTAEENNKIASYDFDKILEFTYNDNKNFIEYFDNIVDKYINNYENINKYLKKFEEIKSKKDQLRCLLLPDYYVKKDSYLINATYIVKFKPQLKARLEYFFTMYFKGFMNIQENTIKGLDDISKYSIKDNNTLIKGFVDYLNKNCKKTNSVTLNGSDISGVDFNDAMIKINNLKQARQNEINEELLNKVGDDIKCFFQDSNKKIEDIKKSLTSDIKGIKTKEQYNQFKYKNPKEIDKYITSELDKIKNHYEKYNKFIVKDKNLVLIINNINNNKKLCCEAIVNALNLKSNEIFIVNLNYNIKEQIKIKDDIINLCNDFINKNKTYDSRKTYGELYKYIIDSLSCIDNIFKVDQSIKDSTDVINEDELLLTLEIKKFYFKDEYKEKPIDSKHDDPKHDGPNKDDEDKGGNNGKIGESEDSQIKGNNRCCRCCNNKNKNSKNKDNKNNKKTCCAKKV